MIKAMTMVDSHLIKFTFDEQRKYTGTGNEKTVLYLAYPR